VRQFKAYLLSAHVLLLACTTTGLMEVFRVPALCDHYSEHCTRIGEDVGVIDFMLLHYFDPGHEESDPTGHAGLPFHGAGAHPPLCSGPLTWQVTPAPNEGNKVLLSAAYDEHVGRWPGRSVFHPPKVS
jgi:hypothetical protein